MAAAALEEKRQRAQGDRQRALRSGDFEAARNAEGELSRIDGMIAGAGDVEDEDDPVGRMIAGAEDVEDKAGAGGPGKNSESGRKAADGVLGGWASRTFGRDVARALMGRPGGNEYDIKAMTQRTLADNAARAAAVNGMEAQQHQARADEDPFSKAGEKASAANDERNSQRVQTAKTYGSGVGRLRETTAMDVGAEEDRAERERKSAEDSREQQTKKREAGIAYRGLGGMSEVKSADLDEDINRSDRLAKGLGSGDEGAGEGPQAGPEEGPPEPDEGQPEGQPESQPAGDGAGAATFQNLTNLAGGSEMRRTKDADGNVRAFRVKDLGGGRYQITDWDGQARASANPGNDPSRAPEYTEEMERQLRQTYSQHPEFQKRQGESDGEWTARINGELGRGGNMGDRGSSFGSTYMGDVSDERAKELLAPVRAAYMRSVIGSLEDGTGIGPEEFELLARLAGAFEHGGRKRDFFNDGDWEDDEDGSVLRGYADHVMNYLYTYKPEARKIDPSIDCSEEHIGPMAQDLEKVNPAVVKETAEGVKTVDTSRLALMNAGAIGDLARRLDELSERLRAAGI